MSEFHDSKRKKFKNYSLRLFNKSEVKIETIIDIGVKTKTPSLINNFPNAFHYLVEPVKEFCDKIPDNYNSINYEIINKAALDRTGIVTLGVRTTSHGNSITHSSVTTVNKPVEEQREIEAITVDELVIKKGINPKHSILKIDVDGNDIEVLKGAATTLHDIAMLIVEVPVYDMLVMNSYLANFPLFLWDICDLTYYKEKLVQFDLTLLNKRYINTPSLNPWKDGSFNMSEWKIGV